MTVDSKNKDNKKFCIDCGKELELGHIRKGRCQPCYNIFSMRLCIDCNQYRLIVNKGRCINCANKIRPYKICPQCNKSYNIRGKICQNCRKKKRQDKVPKKKCECSPECPEMIPIITTKGKPMRYKKGHSPKNERSPNWVDEPSESNGYRSIRAPDNPKCHKNGKMKRHRWIYEQYYNVCLLPWIEIHHINGIKTDNRIENLQPVTKKEHRIIEFSGRQYDLIDMSGRRCSDPECPHPEKITYRKHKDGRLRPSWRTDGKGNIICPTCDARNRYRRKKNL